MAYSVDKGEVSFGGGKVERDPNRPDGDNDVVQNPEETVSAINNPNSFFNTGVFSNALENFDAYNLNQNYNLRNKLLKDYGLATDAALSDLDTNPALKEGFMANQPTSLFGGYFNPDQNTLQNLGAGAYNAVGLETLGLGGIGLTGMANWAADIFSGKPVDSATPGGYTVPDDFDYTDMYRTEGQTQSLGSNLKSFLNDTFETDFFDAESGRYLDREKMLEAGAKYNSIAGLTNEAIQEGLANNHFSNPEQAYNQFLDKQLAAAELNENTRGKDPSGISEADIQNQQMAGFSSEQKAMYDNLISMGYDHDYAIKYIEMI